MPRPTSLRLDLPDGPVRFVGGPWNNKFVDVDPTISKSGQVSVLEPIAEPAAIAERLGNKSWFRRAEFRGLGH